MNKPEPVKSFSEAELVLSDFLNHYATKKNQSPYHMDRLHALLGFLGVQHSKSLPTVDQKHSHYKKDVAHLKMVDVYRVLDLFKVTNQAVGHAIKKLLVPGMRGGGKNLEQDYREAVDSINRALQMIAEDDVDRE